MQVIMKETQRGSEDGRICKRYFKGETYDLTDALAKSFLRNGWAVEVKPEPLTQGELLTLIGAMRRAGKHPVCVINPLNGGDHAA